VLLEKCSCVGVAAIVRHTIQEDLRIYSRCMFCSSSPTIKTQSFEPWLGFIHTLNKHNAPLLLRSFVSRIAAPLLFGLASVI
jgi:hypothetical protein